MIERDGVLPSLWQDTTNDAASSYVRDRIPVTAGDGYDVIIAGGGVTGVTTALLLQEAGFRCAIAEASSLCFGTTGGTTAHLNTVLDTPYTTIASHFGKEGARLVAEAVRESIDLVRHICERYAIDAGFEFQTAYIYSQTEKQTEQLEAMRAAAADAGVKMLYTEVMTAPLAKKKVLAAGGQAKIHPTRYVLGMARAFQVLGGRIFEGCRVQGSEENDGVVVVHTDRGDLRCRNLIFATHIPPGISLLDTRCAPYRSYAIAVTLKVDYPDGLIYDLEEPFNYYRTQTIDGKSFLIAGGEDHKTGHQPITDTCFNKLESHVRRLFEVAAVNYRWSSQYLEPTDGLPYIGHLPGEPGRRFVATGFSGNGMVYGGVAAALFRDLLLKTENKFIKLFDPNRIKPVAGLKHFVRENADVAKKWLGKFLPADKLSGLADLAPSEARVVRLEGETVALYKGEDGVIHALSPTCPHMGCHVSWNSAEKSWDCPCHGARYAIDGTMITGPAAHDLERINIRALMEK